jgi:hypothetical protein
MPHRTVVLKVASRSQANILASRCMERGVDVDIAMNRQANYAYPMLVSLLIDDDAITDTEDFIQTVTDGLDVQEEVT